MTKLRQKKRCLETILELWKHRAFFPHGRRPFEDFEPVFRALASLDPENPSPHFYSYPSGRSTELNEFSEVSDEVQKWLDIAQGIDRAARIWLEFVFHQAALNARDEKTIAWIENALGVSNGEDVSTIAYLVVMEPESEGETVTEQEKRATEEKLRSRIERLDAFTDLSQYLRTEFTSALETLTQDDSSTDIGGADSQQ